MNPVLSRPPQALKKAPPTPKGVRARDRLLAAAGAVFSEKGYGRSGVADICAAADMAVGGFYRYFSGKEEVLETLVSGLEDELVRALKDRAPAGDLRLEAEAAANLYFGFVRRNREAYQAMREAEFSGGRSSGKFYDSFAAVLCERFFGPGRGGLAEEISVYSFIGALSFVAARSLIWESRPMPAKAASDAAVVFVNGVSSREPDFAALIAAANGLRRRPARSPETTAERLLVSAEEVFGKMGYGPAHISDITGNAGYAAGTFYTCFKSKRDALGRLVVALREELVSRAFLYSRESASRTETEVAAFLALFDFIGEHPHGYKILREAEFVDPRLTGDFYLYILKDYSERMRASALPGEFAISDHGALSLMMMGIGHMLGLKYGLLKGAAPGSKKMELMLRRVFGGIK